MDVSQMAFRLREDKFRRAFKKPAGDNYVNYVTIMLPRHNGPIIVTHHVCCVWITCGSRVIGHVCGYIPRPRTKKRA
eukprot:2004815-Prymnesium_polylepis.1